MPPPTLRRRSLESLDRPQPFHLDAPAPPARPRPALLAGAVAVAALVALIVLAGPGRRASPPAPPLFPHGGPADCVPAPVFARAAFFADRGGFTHPISTSSPTAQALFDTGLLLAAGFHSAAAASAFRGAAAADPAAAMPHCGLALVAGPGANRAPLDEDADADPPPFPAFRPADLPAATAAAAACAARADAALAAAPTSPTAARDAAWAGAVAARFAEGTGRGPARADADAAFARAMLAVAADHADADAAAWAADAFVAGRQWDYRDAASGAFLPHAASAVAAANASLALDPAHPLALHLLVHLHETGTPARGGPALGLAAGDGEAAAGALAGPGPWRAARVGHLLHMPGHLYARVGWWSDAVRVGVAATTADLEAAAACIEAYAVEHNAASLAFAANTNGARTVAAAAVDFLADAPARGGPALAYAGGTADVAARTFHHVVFANWSFLEQDPAPGPLARTACMAGGRETATVAWALGRALAAAARAGAGTRSRADAAAAVAAVEAAAAAVPPEAVTAPGPPPGLYACEHGAVAAAAVAAARARLALLDGDAARAADVLAPAVALQAAAPYFEPPRHAWPLAPCLGWLRLQAGDVAGAEAAFRGDLAARPANPRGLLGLSLARAAAGDAAGAADARRGAERRWRGGEGEGLASPCAAFEGVK